MTRDVSSFYSGGQINRNDLLINVSLLPVSEIQKFKNRIKALEKTKSLPPSASKSVKPFGREKDFNGEGSNGTWEISFISDPFCWKRSWHLVKEKAG